MLGAPDDDTGRMQRTSSLHALLQRGRRVQVEDLRLEERRLVAYLSSMREFIVYNLQSESMSPMLVSQKFSASALDDSIAMLPDQTEFRQCLTLILENFLTLARSSMQTAVL